MVEITGETHATPSKIVKGQQRIAIAVCLSEVSHNTLSVYSAQLSLAIHNYRIIEWVFPCFLEYSGSMCSVVNLMSY